jgi:hypothetical protein
LEIRALASVGVTVEVTNEMVGELAGVMDRAILRSLKRQGKAAMYAGAHHEAMTPREVPSKEALLKN